ncbi:sugar ABC transporter substrate-binding protein [Cellulomonas hominis]|uniref:sugar ABC transporter substrate-binding protein n=1 Tax=Cellulomonas hominis TaxID=156981 RepID=UPI001B9FFA51|nr:extracellular solute-binding protein [Cellulomonas hominis]VTR75788.1 hypothetical protein CHMI_00541 [Cellulomonas hominis]
MSLHTVRRLAAASLTVGAIAALTACSGGSTGSGGSGPATITLWTHNGGNDAELAVNQQIVDDFNASQTDYEVELESFPQTSYNDAVVAAASSKKLPCVLDIDSPNVPNWAWAGYIQPLGLDDAEFEGQLPSTVGEVDGEVYSFGHYDVALAYFTRASALEAVGARIPTTEDPWTQEELDDVLAKLKATGQYDYPLDLGTGGTGEWITYAYSPFLQSAGGDLIDRDGYTTASGALDGEAALDWAAWMQGLVSDGYISAKSGEDATVDFVNGTSAILYSGSWAYDSVREAFGEDAIVIPPVDLGEGPKIGGGSWQWAMSSQCEEVEGARAYLEFSHQTEYVVALADATGTIPATDEAAAELQDYAPGGDKEVFRTFAQDYAVVRPATPAYPYITSVFQKATQDILSGGDAASILDKAVSDIDNDIAQNGDYAF